MNLLFVNYGEIINNTGSQFTVVANELTRLGHQCCAVVPKLSIDASYAEGMNLPCLSYKEALSDKGALFPDDTKADLIVAITPREIIRSFIEDYFQDQPIEQRSPLFVHLEDNENELTKRFTRRSIEEICNLPHEQIHERIIPPGLSCPICWPEFLSKASGLTYIHPALQKLAPLSIPSHQFSPPIDFDLFNPDKYCAELSELRKKFGISPDEKIISYVGNTHAANMENIRELYSIVHRLNQSGIKTRLLRTGIQNLDFYDSLLFDARQFTIELGFIPRHEVPAVIAVADLILMPTHSDQYDNYRLPSSLPEHLAMGKCVITTEAGLGAELQDGVNAVIMDMEKTDLLLERCLKLLKDSNICRNIGEGAKAFAQKRFHRNTIIQLEQFYQRVLKFQS